MQRTKIIAIATLCLFILIPFYGHVYAKKQKETPEFKPSIPEMPTEIITRPLTPGTGEYVQHGTGNQTIVPGELPKKNGKKK